MKFAFRIPTRSMIIMFALLAGFSASASGGSSGIEDLVSLKEVAAAQERTDGYFDVVCANGNREKVSSSDIRYNDVCPNSRSSTMTNMQSVLKRRDGMFDVVCRDSSKTLANMQQIFESDVCAQATNTIVIEDGVYGSPGRSDSTLRATQSGTRLTNVHVEILNLKADMSCYENLCDGRFPGYSQTFHVRVLSRTSFEFYYDSRQGVAIFTKKN